MRVSQVFRAFVARKKSRCKLIGFRLVIPHDTIPSTVSCNHKKTNDTMKLITDSEDLEKTFYDFLISIQITTG